MKTKLSIFFFSFLFLNCFSQDKTSLIDSLCDHGIDIANSFPDSSLCLFERAFFISAENNSNYGKAKSLFLKSCILTDQSKYDESKKCLDVAYPLSVEIKDSLRMAGCLNGYGLIFLYQNKYDSAQYYFLKLKLLAEEMQHDILKNSALLNLSAIYNETGLFAETVELLFEPLAFFLKNDVKIESGMCYQNLGDAFNGLKDSANCIKYYKKALDIYLEIDNKSQISEMYQNLGIVYRESGDFDAAQQEFQKAIQIADTISYLRGKATALSQLGVLYLQRGEFNLAKNTLDDAIELSDEIHLSDTGDFSKYQMAKLFQKQKKYNETLKILDVVNKSAPKYNNSELVMDVLNLKSEIYWQMGDYKKAFQTNREYLKIREQILSVENIRKAAIQEQKYEFSLLSEQIKAKNEQEKKVLETSLANQRNKKIFAFSLSLSILGFLVFVLFELKQNIRKNKLLVEKNAQLILLNKQMTKNKKKRSQKVNDEKAKDILIRVEELVENGKLFTDANLSLESVAAQIGTNKGYLSEVINTFYNKSFTDYVNCLRVNHIQLKFKKGDYISRSFEGIAQDAGFTSRATFLRAFKKFTGVTPSFYIQELSNIRT